MKAVFLALASQGYEVVQSTSPDGGEFFAEAMNGSRHGANWNPPPVEIVSHDENGKPLQPFDAALMGFAGLGFILTPKAVEQVGKFLSDYGEILKLRCEDAELYTFNCTVTVPALDLERSTVRRFPDGQVYAIRKHVFIPSVVVANDIFRIPGMRVSDIYFTERAVGAWRRAELRGIEFQEVWRQL